MPHPSVIHRKEGHMSTAQRDRTGYGVAVEGILGGYLAHLRSHRDLVESSLRRHERCASAFLAQMAPESGLCLAEALTVDGVQSYSTAYARQHGHWAVHNMLSTLRVLLQYFYIEGHLPQRSVRSCSLSAGSSTEPCSSRYQRC